MKTIIITGAGSGIGRSTTQLFLDEGWEVGLSVAVARRLRRQRRGVPVRWSCPAT